jgi:16S rRNA G1207 methylase RsmC
MLQMLDLTATDRFLEPSAGEGALVLPMLGDKVPRPAVIVMIEIDERTHAKLINVAEAFRVVVPDYPVAALHDDFLSLTLDYRPSVICMNPPFTEGRGEAHIRKAYEMLAPGGRMVAIAGESDFNPGKTVFPGWLAAHGAVIEPAPDDGFENTTARARIIYMTKP